MRQSTERPELVASSRWLRCWRSPRRALRPARPRLTSPADLPSLETAVLVEPAIDVAELRLTAERDPRALGPLSIGTPAAGLLLNPVPFPEGPFWRLREPSEAWATDETIDFVVAAIEARRGALSRDRRGS